MHHDILLCFNTANQDDIDKSLNYWAQKYDGNWNLKVADLCKLYGAKQTTLVADVKSAATAYVLNARCSWCNVPSTTSSRSSLGGFGNFSHRVYGMNRVHLCPTCDEHWLDLLNEQVEARLQKEKAEKVNLIDHLNAKHMVSFAEDPQLIDAIYLYALLDSSNYSQSSEFGHQFFELIHKLTGSEIMDTSVLTHLYKRGFIRLSTSTSSEALRHTNNSTEVNFSIARWELCDFLSGFSYVDLMKHLSNQFEDVEICRSDLLFLWEQVALSECQGRLISVAKTYRFGNFGVGEKTNHALLYALTDLSIPQVWGVCETVCKNIAARIQSGNLAHYMAHTHVPGSLTKFVDRAIQDGWTIWPRSRTNWDTEATLTTLFFSRIAVDREASFRTLTTKTIEKLI